MPGLMYFIDSSMGVAGDMLLSSFIDLDILDREKVRRVLETAGNVMGPTSVRIRKIDEPFEATGLDITHDEFSHVSGRQMQAHIMRGADIIGLRRGKDFARKVLDTILVAETKVHECSMDDIHLHETGSPDTLVDILGMAYFYEKLKLYDEKICGTPISVGKGKVKIAHGIVDVPAPATAEILQTMDFKPGPHEGEMATPTGVAILSGLLQIQMEMPDDIPQKTGTGAGTKKFGGTLGAIRVQILDDDFE